jgi:hypothetical protein
MANYAVIDNGTVINTIVADSLEVAQEVTGQTCIEYTEENPLGVNWSWDATADAYIIPSPYASWVYNYTAKTWEAPTPMPTEEGMGYTWDEATTSWVSFDLPSEE